MMRILSSIPGRYFLFLSALIFASSNSVVRKLIDIGEMQDLMHNPVSFCNVLFAGNVCALILLLFVQRKKLSRKAFRNVTRRQWVWMIILGVLTGALAPALIFSALGITTVTNVILVSRVELVGILLLSFFVLKERLSGWQITGAMLALFGVILTVLLQDQGMGMEGVSKGLMIGRGELYTIVAACAYAISTVFGKKYLVPVNGAVQMFVRTTIGTAVFFVIVLALFGPMHFMDVFSPFLWKWMVLYGAVIVVLGQLFWYRGLEDSKGFDTVIASTLNPIAGIAVAFLLLGEVPGFAQYIGAGLIIFGIVVSQFRVLFRARTSKAVVRAENGFEGI